MKERPTDQEQRLSEIVARLTAATPGPWIIVPPPLDDTGTRVMSNPAPSVFRHICSTANRMPWSDHEKRAEADADLIANAPADLAWLIAELATAREAAASDEMVRAARTERDAALVELGEARAEIDEAFAILGEPVRGHLRTRLVPLARQMADNFSRLASFAEQLQRAEGEQATRAVQIVEELAAEWGKDFPDSLREGLVRRLGERTPSDARRSR